MWLQGDRDDDPYAGKPESEWSAKRMVIRILMYPLCITLIIFGIYILFNNHAFRDIQVGSGLIAFCAYYLYIDFKILFGRKK
jgi:hypothetical protein